MLVRELVKRNVFLLSYTLFSFLPNTFIFFLKYFFGLDFLNSFNFLNFGIIAIISFNACYSFLIIVSDPYMRKFFKPYYNLLNFLKGNNRTNEVNKLSDLIELVKDDEHDLNKTLLLSKIADYNYANIYLKSEQQEMKYLPNKKNDFGDVNVFNEKESNDNLNKFLNTRRKSKDNNLVLVNNDGKSNNNNIYKITIENSDLNWICQNSNNSLNEKNNIISNSKISQFLLGNQQNEISNKIDKDNISELSFNKKRDNSIEVASMGSYESAELLTNKKSNFNGLIHKRCKKIFNFFSF